MGNWASEFLSGRVDFGVSRLDWRVTSTLRKQIHRQPVGIHTICHVLLSQHVLHLMVCTVCLYVCVSGGCVCVCVWFETK